mmetsp:Transcript_17036/g.39017  ORF Transcript_17036/g.39017 Transcript_17036/m.39017 type:complete len:361 (-) Transcript_17036:561-1643(-)
MLWGLESGMRVQVTSEEEHGTGIKLNADQGELMPYLLNMYFEPCIGQLTSVVPNSNSTATTGFSLSKSSCNLATPQLLSFFLSNSAIDWLHPRSSHSSAMLRRSSSRKKCEWPTSTIEASLLNRTCERSSLMRSATRSLLSSIESHHLCCTRRRSNCGLLSLSASSGASLYRCLIAARTLCASCSPCHFPLESIPPRLRFSRRFGLSSSLASGRRASIGASPIKQVCTARVSGLHMTRSDAISASASAPPASSTACSRSACARPTRLSGWSVSPIIAPTFLAACASFHTDSPCRTMYTVFLCCKVLVGMRCSRVMARLLPLSCLTVSTTSSVGGAPISSSLTFTSAMPISSLLRKPMSTS